VENCKYKLSLCAGYTDSAGFHHLYNCPSLRDEDINPTFPELEGSWVRKEQLDTLTQAVSDCGGGDGTWKKAYLIQIMMGLHMIF